MLQMHVGVLWHRMFKSCNSCIQCIQLSIKWHNSFPHSRGKNHTKNKNKHAGYNNLKVQLYGVGTLSEGRRKCACAHLRGPPIKVHGHLINHLLGRPERDSVHPHRHTNMYLTAESHRIPLSDGNHIPLLGLGTYGDPQTVRWMF